MTTNKKDKNKKDDSKYCKYCNNEFTEKDFSYGSKKKVSEKSCIWGGLEIISIKIKRIKCTNCGKKYSTRDKSLNYIYK